MALMKSVANCDFNHNVEHGSASTAKVSPTMFQNRYKTLQTTFHSAFPKQTRLMALMRPVANCDFNHNSEHGKATTANVCLPCSKTGIITSDDFSWCISKADGIGH